MQLLQINQLVLNGSVQMDKGIIKNLYIHFKAYAYKINPCVCNYCK